MKENFHSYQKAVMFFPGKKSFTAIMVYWMQRHVEQAGEQDCGFNKTLKIKGN